MGRMKFPLLIHRVFGTHCKRSEVRVIGRAKLRRLEMRGVSTAKRSQATRKEGIERAILSHLLSLALCVVLLPLGISSTIACA